MMLPSVDLPAPFGPMIACTWPAPTSSERPLRMSLPATRAWRFSIFSMVFPGVARWNRVFGGGAGSAAGALEGDATPGIGTVGDLVALHVVGTGEHRQGGAVDRGGTVGETRGGRRRRVREALVDHAERAVRLRPEHAVAAFVLGTEMQALAGDRDDLGAVGLGPAPHFHAVGGEFHDEVGQQRRIVDRQRRYLRHRRHAA